MDYMIGDAVLTPLELQNQFTEKLWPLPRCWSTFRPHFPAPTISARPADQPITFGSFNNLIKLTDRCADFWSAALRAVPEAQLLLKDEVALEPSVQQRVLDQLGSRGVAPDRITFLGRVANWHEHVALYNRVDIALDTTPMTSATTGFEALCMGVPLLAIQTDWMGGRMSSSTLSALGRENWIARNPQDFATNAVQLISEILNRPGNTFKQNLRKEFLASPLNDGASLCRALEKAFAAMAHSRLGPTT
jgi:predicted O-linked N-acetylglucosamine transferase (SPINDLY family)